MITVYHQGTEDFKSQGVVQLMPRILTQPAGLNMCNGA